MARLNDDREREFRIVAQLSKSITLAQTELALSSFDATRGRSLLKFDRRQVPSGGTFVGLFVKTPRGKVQLRVNERDEVSGAEFTCRVRSRQEALAIYAEQVAPLFDHISYLYDVPVFVESVAWIDALNRVWGANFTAPYAEVDVGKLTGEYRVELGAFYALYREALTSQSVFYQFLCFSKILEGAFRWMVPRFFERARAAGVTLERRTPKVPALDAIDTMPAIKRYEGQSIADVFANFLEAEFRNAVAHFKADDEDPVQVSNYFASARIANVLQLARVSARAAIDMLDDYSRQLADALAAAGGPAAPGSP